MRQALEYKDSSFAFCIATIVFFFCRWHLESQPAYNAHLFPSHMTLMHGNTFYIVYQLTSCLKLMFVVGKFKLLHAICPFKRFVVKFNLFGPNFSHENIIPMDWRGEKF